MTTPWELIQQLESNNSKTFKEEFLRNCASSHSNDIFFQGLQLALSNFDTFGVKKVPIRSGVDGPGVGFDIFESLCGSLIDRELTGDDARDQIELIMEQCSNEQWNDWYRRILTKDLKAGFSETTVNKAVKEYPQYSIPVFSCQLAHDGKDEIGRFVGKKMIDVKLDGARVLTIINPNGVVNQVSRNGKEVANFPKIREQFEKVANYFKEPYIIDGEMMSSSFQDLMKQFTRKTDVQTDDSVYYVFDIISVREFMKGKSTAKQERRREDLAEFINSYHPYVLPNVSVVGYEIVDFDTPEGRQKFEEINRKAILNKYEGVMIKDPNGFYETKRSWAWMKKKPTISVSLEVIGFEYGEAGSKYEKVLGALVGSGVDDGKTIVTNVGGGYSDEQRQNIADHKDEVIGMIMEVEADAITQNQNGTYSLRFPRFKTFRGFAKGEKL